MSGSKPTAIMAPHAGLVMAISEIIAPVVIAIASTLISAFSKLGKSRKVGSLHEGAGHTKTSPAPHVALVMVPGKFMTSPMRYL